MINWNLEWKNLNSWINGTLVALSVSFSLFLWVRFLYYNWASIGPFQKILLVLLPAHSVSLILITALKAVRLRNKERLTKKNTG